MDIKKFYSRKKFLIFIIVLVFICISYSLYNVILDPNKSAIIKINNGDSTAKISQELKEKNIIKSTLVFRALSKLYKYDGKYKEGKYKVNTKKGYKGIMDQLVHDKPIIDFTKVTIPEGFTANEIAERLAKLKLINKAKFLNACNKIYDYPFLKDTISSKIKLEGYLFPDTYYIKKQETEEQIVKTMLDRFNTAYKKIYIHLLNKSKVPLNKIVTMASLVEREAKIQSERPVIAGVFYNRLKINMKLQSCASVQYILNNHKLILSNSDIKIKSPYNTYLNPGLPLGPICNPGIASVVAAIKPVKTPYYYFVAKGDGSHHFSASYQEHLKAERKYEKTYKNK